MTRYKIITCNVRGAFGVDGENEFELRKEALARKLTELSPDVIGFQEVSHKMRMELIALIDEKYPGLLQTRYGEDISLEGIAKKRGFVISKGEYDIERSANAVIDDFRKGRIGKITLD